jgi:hypothetical protein
MGLRVILFSEAVTVHPRLPKTLFGGQAGLSKGASLRRSCFDKACPERTVRPFESLRANGESEGSARTA